MILYICSNKSVIVQIQIYFMWSEDINERESKERKTLDKNKINKNNLVNYRKEDGTKIFILLYYFSFNWYLHTNYYKEAHDEE